MKGAQYGVVTEHSFLLTSSVMVASSKQLSLILFLSRSGEKQKLQYCSQKEQQA